MESSQVRLLVAFMYYYDRHRAWQLLQSGATSQSSLLASSSSPGKLVYSGPIQHLRPDRFKHFDVCLNRNLRGMRIPGLDEVYC
jgi:hypothetical protein